MITRRRFLEGSALLSSLFFSGPGWALQAGEPSRTARGAALQRAAHQLLEVPRVFDDPIALRIFGAEGVRWLGQNLDQYRSISSRAMRAFLVMRRQVENSRTKARSFSERVVHAFLLQGVGASQDAREAWAALARERPDLPEAAALAR